MITLTTGQLEAWIATFAYPLFRILSFIAAAPLLSTAGVPRRIKLVLGLGITVAIAPGLPDMPAIPPASLPGLLLILQQVVIGTAMGFIARALFSAVDMSGEFISAQAGLGFATSYDPLNSSQTPVISEFMSLMSFLLFLSMNGHLLFVGTLAESFHLLPVGNVFPTNGHWLGIAGLGSKIFTTALLISLPVIVALSITNIALAVLTRAAPQLNLFSIGFPVTLIIGFVGLALGLDYVAAPLQVLYEHTFDTMSAFARTAGRQ